METESIEASQAESSARAAVDVSDADVAEQGMVPTAPARLAQDTEAAVVGGYFSNGTAIVEVTPSLDRAGYRGLTVTCTRQNGEVVSACRDQTLYWPAGGVEAIAVEPGFGPSAETLTMRLPMGATYGLTFDYGGGKVVAEVDVPERILGVERDVWECFSDTSNVGRGFPYLGVGCAGWYQETITKWDQSAPVRVWVNPIGDEEYIELFRNVLAKLAPHIEPQFRVCRQTSKRELLCQRGHFRLDTQC